MTGESGAAAKIARQHAAVRQRGGYFEDAQRGLIEVRGTDRASWLHNLTTNVVRTLQPGEGNYAFAITAQGRTLFDLNIVVREENIWLDIDRRWMAAALAHLNKYLIVEDVKLADISAGWAHFVVLGPGAGEVVKELGLAANFGNFANLQHAGGLVDECAGVVVRNNLGPVMRADLWAEATRRAAFAARLAEASARAGLVAIGEEVAEVIRIEVGQPASVVDLDEQVIPPETLQIERGISYVKGCYLGQEVIERMRSRGSMARRLVGLRVEGEALPPHNGPIFSGAKEIGRVTSSCHSFALPGVLALGYVKTLMLGAGQPLQVALDEKTAAPAQLVELPLSYWRTA